MVSTSAIACGIIGITSGYYVLRHLLSRIWRRDIKGKVILITGASSGLGEGNHILPTGF